MTSLAASPLIAARTAAVSENSRRTRWGWGVALLALAAAALTGWGVGASMSDYYGSIALSMSQNWSNFFFGALDPSGTVTLDKIPGSFWIPALFIKAFGFSPWATVIPNALAATASVVVTAFAARRWAGPAAGLVAGAIVATTPILVAVARSNQPETFFVLCLALTAWAATRALERRSLGWLIAAGAFVAAGFQTYMLESWAVWPALAAAYLCTRQSWRRRITHVAIAGASSLALSLVWIVIVSLIPASSRPYIGSTLANSPWEMVFGYNGLGRFGSATSDASAYHSFTPPFSGGASPFRLLNEALAGQIGWLLPTAIVAIAVLIALRFRRPLLVFGAVWFATFAAMFSVVAGMHQFYTASLSIPVALLIGTAFAFARRRRVLWAQLALPLTAAATALAISLSIGASTYSVPAALVQCILAIGAALLILWDARRGVRRTLTTVVATVALILTPAVWSVVTVGAPNSTNPVAGGASASAIVGFSARGPAGFGGLPGTGGAGSFAGRGMPGGVANGAGHTRGQRPGSAAMTRPRDAAGSTGAFGGLVRGGSGGGSADGATISWLREHRGSASYLVATFGAQSAASLIIDNGGDAVLPIGGFNGRDPAPTLAAFQQLITDGSLRYVLTSGGSPFGGGFGGAFSAAAATDTSMSAQIHTWVLANCTEVMDAGVTGVYDCAG